MISTASFLVLFSVVVGAALGYRRPIWGFALLAGLVSVTSGLPWHLGLGNLPLNHGFLLGLIAGVGVRVARRTSPSSGRGTADRQLARLWTCVLFVLLPIGVATLLALLRLKLTWPSEPALAAGDFVRALLTYYPDGAPGKIQAAYVAMLGPVVLLLILPHLEEARNRRILQTAILTGLTLAILAPLFQIPWMQQWARPDLGYDASGLAGFFQDPHSYAAYLAMGLGMALGISLGWLGRRRRGYATLAFLLAIAAFVPLLYTNSRSGLIATSLTVAVLAVLTLMRSVTNQPATLPRWTRIAALAVLLFMVGSAALLISSSGARSNVYDQLSRMGNERMWALLRGDQSVWELPEIDRRRALLGKAAAIIGRRPLWGIGPRGFQDEDVTLISFDGSTLDNNYMMEHVHNYYLQIATDYGVPALLGLLLLISVTVGTVVRGAWRCTEPLQQGVLTGIAAAQIGFLLFSLVSHPLLLAELQGFYWTLTGLGVATALYSPNAR